MLWPTISRSFLFFLLNISIELVITDITRKPGRIASRATRRKAGEIANILVNDLFTPKNSLIPYTLPRIRQHPTWDTLLNFGGDRIRSWVSGLLRPSKPQPPLLLTGPANSGKTTFHDAMLLPKDSVLWPWKLRDLESWLVLRGIWMMVVEGCPPYYIHILGNRTPELNRDGRYLKWCLTNRERIEEPRILQFDLKPPALLIPKPDMIRRLEDERDDFRSTLLRYAA